MNASIQQAAELYAASGLSVVPTLQDKRAAVPWAEYQKKRIRPADTAELFKRAYGVAVVGGKVSGNLEVLDFDAGGALFDAWAALIPKDLLERLAIERTPSGGVHVFYRCAGEVSGNSKLAFLIKGGKPEIAIETRGEGGYSCTDPTPGYAFHQNSLHGVVKISAEDRETLIEAARSLNQHIPEAQEARKSPERAPGDGLRPGDDFNDRGDVRALLLDEGWTPEGHGTVNGTPAEYWTRPGKKRGRGATLIDGKVLYVFTSNAAPFEPERAYPPFSVYALLKHGGDFKEAAKALHSEGYGTAPPPPTTAAGDEIPAGDVLKAAYDGQAGAARLFTRLKAGRLCFDHAQGRWHIWTGHHWCEDPHEEPLAAVGEVQELFEGARAHANGELALLGQRMKETKDAAAQAELKAQQAALEAQEKALAGQVKALNLLWTRKAVVEFATVGAGSLGISGDQWDREPWLLPVQNGVIDLRTGDLRPGRPDEYLKTACPISYDPKAPRPLWDKFILEIFDQNGDMAAFIRRVLGMALVGDNLEHALFVLWGVGWNGKDSLLGVVAKALGPLAGPVQAEFLLDQTRARSSAGPSADTMSLRGRRLAWASETNEGRRLDAGRVKALSGDKFLTGRSPYGRRDVVFPVTHTLFLLTNNRPHVPADDFALWKRLHLIPFTLSFVDDPQGPNERKRDRSLSAKLETELPGVLAWMVQGCLEWQREGLNPPEVVKQATLAYRNAEDQIAAFIEDSCVLNDNAVVAAKALYEAYRQWSLDNGLKPLSGTAFGERMGKRFEKGRPYIAGKQRYAYLGIGILDQ